MKFIMSLLLSVLLTLNLNAQSKIYQYGLAKMEGRAITALPSGLYAATETVGDTAGSGIHFTVYNQLGNILIDKVITVNKPLGILNVDIEYAKINGGEQLFLVAQNNSAENVDYNTIVVILMDLSGNILKSKEIVSTDINYVNLFAMDAIYDPGEEAFLVCGTAITPYNIPPSMVMWGPDRDKQAFLLKLDANLNASAMMFYNSDAGSGLVNDYDIATRVRVTAKGEYYLMGSENMDKGLGEHIAGIRNMLVNPATLIPIWSKPVNFNRHSSMENSVDMVEIQGPNGPEFVVLANSSDTNMYFLPNNYYQMAKWWLFRADPSTGNLLYNNFETLWPYSYYTTLNSGTTNIWTHKCHDIGYSLHKGNKPGEVVVSGLKFPTINRQCHTMAWGSSYMSPMADVVPFMATVDVSGYPTAVVSHVEYNSWLTGSYWGVFTGSLYMYNLPYVQYYLLNYLGRFVDRESPGNPYCMTTPVAYLETKVLDINSNTQNGCDDVSCTYSILETIMRPVYPNLDERKYDLLPDVKDFTLHEYKPTVVKTDDCSTAYRESLPAGNNEFIPVGRASLFPNPVSDQVTVSFSKKYYGEHLYITMEDITGKQVADFSSHLIKNNLLTVKLPLLSDGVYFLVLRSDKGYEKLKLVVDR